MDSVAEKILVTGGAGFIGSHSVERLLEKGHRVRVLDNLSTGRADNLPLQHPNLELIVGDITDEACVERAMHGIGRCLHLAAQISVERSVEHPVASCTTNVLGFVQVLQAARRHQVRRFVYASSAAVYGNAACLPLSETAQPHPLSPYGLEKHVNEQYADLFQRLDGLSCLGLRYFNVYGPRQDAASPYAGVISIFIERIRRGLPLTIHGDGRQSRDFIFVGDVAKANEAALFSKSTGVCNIASGVATSLLELVEMLAAFSPETELEFAPPRPGDIRHSSGDPSRMRRELGITELTPPENGLRILWDSVIGQCASAS